MQPDPEKEKQLAAIEAVKYISDHSTIGLGTGSTVFYAISEIGKMVHAGLTIRAVATSQNTEKQAAALGIPLVDINTVDAIDLTIDGTDEFDDRLDMIKGGDGALFKEKIVAAMSKTVIIIADSSKKVASLGKFKLPLEVVPFAVSYVLRQVGLLNGKGIIRMEQEKPLLTEQGNYIIDADFGLIQNPALLSTKLNEIDGLLVHGLFIQTASKVIMGTEHVTVTFDRPAAGR